jgi:hypothetical protein
MISTPIHFRPSRVDGLPDVDEVRITPQQLEVRSAGQWRAFPFLSFGRGREISSRRVPVGHLRYSNDSYADSHFVFYTDPQITIYSN